MHRQSASCFRNRTAGRSPGYPYAYGNRQFYREFGWGEELVNHPRRWPVGHGPIQAGGRFSLPDKRTDQVIWKPTWSIGIRPGYRLQRIIFDNTLAQHDAVELVKTGEGRVDLVSELSPLETLRVAQSPFAKVVKNRGTGETCSASSTCAKRGARGAMCGCARQSILPSIGKICPVYAKAME